MIARGMRSLMGRGLAVRGFSSTPPWREKADNYELEAKKALREENNAKKAHDSMYDCLREHLKNEPDGSLKISQVMQYLISLHLAAFMESKGEERMHVDKAQVLYKHNALLLEKMQEFDLLAKAKLKEANQLAQFGNMFVEEARLAFEKTIGICETHQLLTPTLVFARLHLAKLLQEAEEDATNGNDEIEELYQQALEDGKKLYAADGSQLEILANAEIAAGSHYLNLGKYGVSKPLFEEGIDKMEQVYGPNVNGDFSVINMKSLLVHNLSMLNKHAEAAGRALDIVKFINDDRSQALFQAYPELADCVITCAVALDLNGDAEAAIIVLDRAKDLVGADGNHEPYDELIRMIKRREKNKMGLKKVVDKKN